MIPFRHLFLSPVLRWVGYGVAVALLVWAATEALITFGELQNQRDEALGDAREMAVQRDAVLKSNRLVAAERDQANAEATRLRRAASADSTRAAQAASEARELRRERDRAREALAAATTPSDSIAALVRKSAADDATIAAHVREIDAQKAEAGNLRAALEKQTRTDSILADANAKLEQQIHDDATSAADLASALEKSEPRCRIARVISCPSRTATFVVGSVLGVVTYRAVRDLVKGA